jgi:hypothetical protein
MPPERYGILRAGGCPHDPVSWRGDPINPTPLWSGSRRGPKNRAGREKRHRSGTAGSMTDLEDVHNISVPCRAFAAGDTAFPPFPDIKGADGRYSWLHVLIANHGIPGQSCHIAPTRPYTGLPSTTHASRQTINCHSRLTTMRRQDGWQICARGGRHRQG